MPFRNQLERDLHFAKHGHEFGAANASDYERMADGFMFGPTQADARECLRPGGKDRVRFGFTTHIQGVACTQPVFVRTLFVVWPARIQRHNGSQGYFTYECGRI